MKAQLCVAAMPFLAIVAFAQNPAPPPSAATPQDSKATSTATTPKQNNDPASEVKTKKYSGVLTDASCAGGGSSTAAAGSGKVAAGTTAAAGAGQAPKTGASDADRAATTDQGQSCSVSASTTKFAVKLKDGQVVKLDDVGNLRAQEALKNKKSWSEAAASGKSINVSANGMLKGDQLITMSIN
jgi:hypothetical protein